MSARTPIRIIGVVALAVALVTLTLTAGPASGGPPGLPPMQYPPQVEQGSTFTLSGTGCSENGVGGTVIGGIGPGWSSVNLPADTDGTWSVELTVPVDEEPGVYEWDVECVDVLNSPYYPFTTIEVVPLGSLQTSTTTTEPPTSDTTEDEAPIAAAQPAAPTLTG